MDRSSGKRYRTTAAPNFPPDANGSVIPAGVTSRLKRRQQNTGQKKTTVKIKKTVTVPKLPSKPKPYRPDFRHHVQHAWATAAANDSTYMIFQCGRYERIGFRDRSSQTLYLSGVIDPINIKDTSYRKVHIGLHAVIVQDALERVQLSETAADTNVRRREHVIQEVESPKGKKPESDSVVSTSEIYEEVANRDLTLVNLDYGAFLSPAPSSFLRILPSCAPGHAKPKKYPSQTRFDAHERVTLVLKDPLGQGAVGVVHPAVVTVTLKSGKVLKCNMAFKFAFTHEQRQKLYHEYQIYGHLSCKAGLEGIVTVHGLFKDPESGALGMLMDDAGQSLRRRELERGCDGRQVTTTPKEKCVLFLRLSYSVLFEIATLAGKHLGAYCRSSMRLVHHDIRADNLLVNSRNEVFLVDFECADYEICWRCLPCSRPWFCAFTSTSSSFMTPRKRRRACNEAPSPVTSKETSSTLANTSPPRSKCVREGPFVETEDVEKLPDSEPSPLISLLEQRLPYLEKNPLHTQSTSTRIPQFNDMHLAKVLRLEHVVFLDGLLEQLCEICDKYVEKAIASGKDQSENFPVFDLPPHDKIKDEKSLVLYFVDVHKQFLSVASALLFGTDWLPVLGFSTEAEGMKAPTHGAADAYLFIDEDAIDQIPEEHRPTIDLIRKYNLHNLVLWEYKNLGFGPEIFTALRTQEGAFKWTACQERASSDDASVSCRLQSHRIDGRPAITGRRTGPDALDIFDIIQKSTTLDSQDDADERPSKRVRIDKNSAKQRTVRSILQQIWTSAVVQDATPMLIGTGNEDCIGFRHRESQTLFLSSPISPSDDAGPPWLKVYIGLYIFALHDAVNRAKQLESATVPLFAQSTLQLRLDKEPYLPNLLSSGLFEKFPIKVELPALDSEIEEVLRTIDRIDLRLHQHCLATTQYNPNTWVLSRFASQRSDCNGPEEVALRATSNPAPSNSASLSSGSHYLDMESLVDKTSRIYRVQFAVARGVADEMDYFSRPLIMKMSRDEQESENLLIEYARYQVLQDIGVTSIVKCYGLFSCPVNAEELRYFLLLEDGGEPISQRPGPSRLAHTKRNCEAYEDALQSLHENGCTHNNITTEHVLLGGSPPHARLISLKDAKVSGRSIMADQKAKDLSALSRCLGLPSKNEAPRESRSGKKHKGQGAAKADPAMPNGRAFRIDSDLFAPVFRETFDANYHPDIFQSKANLEYLPPPSSPISFYDRHIASNLILKNVVYLPSLVRLISKAFDNSVRNFIEDGHKFCTTGYGLPLKPRRESFRDAHTTSAYYRSFVGNLGTRFAYKLALHPERASWDSPLRFYEESSGSGYLFRTEAWMGLTSEMKDFPELMDGVNDALKEKLGKFSRRFARLANWEMFAMTDTAATMLRFSAKNASFKWEMCHTLGMKIKAASNIPPDAPNSLISTRASKRSKRRVGLPTKQSTTVKVEKTVTVPKMPSKPKQYRPEFGHYIQHAWATAATYDSTFMIFQCGRYERIGFRDRASQTLYLSGIIDPINIKNPSYRKLHIGLHTVIVQDALERLELSDSSPKNDIRCRLDEAEEVQARKRKKSKSIIKDDTATFYKEIAQRDLALVILDYGSLCSPAPSSFLRIGPSCVPGLAEEKDYPTQTRFSVHERMSLVLREPLGQGAVGIVHPATVSVASESGQVLKRDMVIKLAFTLEQRKRISNEYEIYGHLYDKNLEGIVTVHGLFKDPESGALAMLMDDAGQSLRRREMERGGDGEQVKTTAEEKEAFRRVLKGLHEAGVRHHDIRADNLLVNSQNEVFIIDLDCADFEVHPDNKEQEMECLDDLLEGRYQFVPRQRDHLGTLSWCKLGPDLLAVTSLDLVHGSTPLPQ
ncbi:LOW QUALITY PROTEIN: hypothetical protein CVT26_009741 [Gymnopilus dilepis]|uniref:Protein kinase domain-containing protein n=1 Tax=Gymnopilus dilepis TaxID=231916 RepID=A0A409YBD2_9AGAR|nr:LOW QUALITY PROTEIN: hypothetical protein CVT26_009741 [Gymnopilus dilepis]